MHNHPQCRAAVKATLVDVRPKGPTSVWKRSMLVRSIGRDSPVSIDRPVTTWPGAPPRSLRRIVGLQESIHDIVSRRVQGKALKAIAEVAKGHKLSHEGVVGVLRSPGGGLMSLYKSSGLGLFALVCLLGETSGSAHAQCNFSNGTSCATEWSGGSVIDLGGLPGSTTSLATGINDAR
jgi:hypothetical protein